MLKSWWESEKSDQTLLGIGVGLILLTLVFAPIMDMDTVFQIMSNLLTRMHEALVNTLGKIQG